ncbi:hypothetical protein EDD11_010018 [Mortierella claussenii]|nr:hypothetical protein EDD11_010018 [Mortierella claussenii]
MPCFKDLRYVVALYVVEHDMHPTMLQYLMVLLQRGIQPTDLEQMSRDDVWTRLVNSGPSLQAHLHSIGALDNRSAINLVINNHLHLVSDIGKDVAVPGPPKTGWIKYCDLFCDNLILWALCNRSRDIRTQQGSVLGIIKDILGDLDLDPTGVKVISNGSLPRDSIFPQRALDDHRQRERGKYSAGYISVKVTLRDMEAATLIQSLHPLLATLRDSFIYLHDLDMATDCQYVTTRDILRAYLETTMPDEVDFVEDRQKVGDHCLSWFKSTQSGQRIRCKVYNKLVQMLESAEVRKQIGSRMEDLVREADNPFSKRFRKAKHRGLSRLEVTFYGNRLRSFTNYQRIMENIKIELEDCPTASVSYQAYWSTMTAKISSMVAIYFADRKVFAYCHWYNSVTGKKYGSHRAQVSKEEAMTLVANYSFNDRPIYLLEASQDGDYAEVSTYVRPPGCQAITLVAGGHKGLYPYKYNSDVVDFADVGLVPSDNITIQWPARRIRKGAAPLAAIVKQHQHEDGPEYILIHEGQVHKASYKAGYILLEEDTTYTMVALAIDEYRGKKAHLATLSDGLKVRCGNSLEAAVLRWLAKHPDHKAPYLVFTTGRKTVVRGYRDIQVSTSA